MQPKILIIENAPKRADGFDYFLEKSSANYQIARVYQQNPLPPVNELDAIIVGGGPMSVFEWDKPENSFLRNVSEFVKDAIERDIPVLGVCLGHQLLAQTLGGKVEVAKNPEYGWHEVEFSTTNDPLFNGMEKVSCFFQYHGDEVTILPEKAVVLAHSTACRYQAFRIDGKNVWGIQFHPEIMPNLAENILVSRRDILNSKGVDVDSMIKKGYQVFGTQNYQLFRNFVKFIAAY